MYDYAGYKSALATMAGYQSTSDADFQAILPSVIAYAEKRIYRDLDLLSTLKRDSSQSVSPTSREITIPSVPYDFVTIQSVNAIEPAGSGAVPDVGTRIPLAPASRDFLDLVYPSAASSGRPEWFAVLDNSILLVGPWPDLTYRVELIGTVRPAPLGLDNTETYVSTHLPDLFIAASMIFMSGFQRNFGAQADDPRTAMSWEQQYQTLRAGVDLEESRKKFQASGWSSHAPARNATDNR